MFNNKALVIETFEYKRKLFIIIENIHSNYAVILVLTSILNEKY